MRVAIAGLLMALCASGNAATPFVDEFNGSALDPAWIVPVGGPVSVSGGQAHAFDTGLQNNFTEVDAGTSIITLMMRPAGDCSAEAYLRAEAYWDDFTSTAEVCEGAVTCGLYAVEPETAAPTNNTWIKAMYFRHGAPGFAMFVRERNDAVEDFEGYFASEDSASTSAAFRLEWTRATNAVSLFADVNSGETAPTTQRNLLQGSYDVYFGASTHLELIVDGWIPNQTPPWPGTETVSANLLKAVFATSLASGVDDWGIY